jgi:hypothetical protein
MPRKPSNSSSVDEILDKAEDVVDLIENAIASATPESEKPKPKLNPNYPTEYFKANGIPYCEWCGGPNRSDFSGNPICEDDIKNCPRLKK